tara:strand:+ start:263 stop:763 length:501 start_codon:yes stop_codon:yes gene_type:complete
MKPGSLNLYLFVLMFFFIFSTTNSQEKVKLQDIQPTFEEESELQEDENNNQTPKIKSKGKKNIGTSETIVKFRALDKITAKTSDISIAIGKKKKIGYLEIMPKKCSRSLENNNEKDVSAYIQVRDLSDKKGDKIFVFNGWTFSSSPTLKPFDHPVYDLWVTGCENI